MSSADFDAYRVTAEDLEEEEEEEGEEEEEDIKDDDAECAMSADEDEPGTDSETSSSGEEEAAKPRISTKAQMAKARLSKEMLAKGRHLEAISHPTRAVTKVLQASTTTTSDVTLPMMRTLINISKPDSDGGAESVMVPVFKKKSAQVKVFDKSVHVCPERIFKPTAKSELSEEAVEFGRILACQLEQRFFSDVNPPPIRDLILLKLNPTAPSVASVCGGGVFGDAQQRRADIKFSRMFADVHAELVHKKLVTDTPRKGDKKKKQKAASEAPDIFQMMVQGMGADDDEDEDADDDGDDDEPPSEQEVFDDLSKNAHAINRAKVDGRFSIIRFFAQHEKEIPTYFTMFRRVGCDISTEGVSESTFSMFGLTLTSRRETMDKSLASAFTFCRSNHAFLFDTIKDSIKTEYDRRHRPSFAAAAHTKKPKRASSLPAKITDIDDAHAALAVADAADAAAAAETPPLTGARAATAAAAAGATSAAMRQRLAPA